MTTTRIFRGLFFALVCLCGNTFLYAANPVNPLSVSLPAGNIVLPEPPAKGSYIWLADSAHYFDAREIRRTKRAVTQEDADLLKLLGYSSISVGQVTTVDSLIAKKREPYLSWLITYGADPAINLPLGDKTIFPKLVRLDSLCEKIKSYNTHESLYRVRQRPYYYFHDYYSGGKLVENTTNYDSYPSGHGYFAGLFGLCMNYIDPDHVAEIKRNSDSFVEQRLILGAHWQSDITAGQTLGAIAFSLALNDPYFKQLLEDAKTELAAYRAAQLAPKRIPDDVTGEQTLEEAQTAIAATLADWKADCDANPEKTMDIEISRTFFCDGYYNSLSLPFDIAEADWSNANKNPLAEGTLKRFVSAEVVDNILNITIESASSIEAGTPYLIKFPAGDNIINPIFKGVRVGTDIAGATETEAMNCKGTFIPYQIPTGKESGHLILGANNALYWPAEDAEYLRGFRAFFQVNNTPAAAPIRHNMSTQLMERKTPTNDPSVPYTNMQTYKLIDDGQVFIIQEGIKYNMSGVVR